MDEELGRYGQPGVFPLSDRFAEMGSIPVDDDGGEHVEPGHAVVLALARAVADFALSPDAERVLECVMSLALVQAGVGPALHIGIEQPVDDEERSFDPSDFAESNGQFVLARKQLRKRDPVRTPSRMTATLIGYARCSTEGRIWPPSARRSWSSASPRIASTPITASPARPGLDQALAAVR